MRPLSPEEQALWSRVAATINPLSREPQVRAPAVLAPDIAAVSAAIAELPPAKAKGRVPPARVQPVAKPRRTTIHGNLDGHWERRLKNGSVPVDRTLDLHGMNLDRAYDALDMALERAIVAGDRVLLLVTGHHRPGEPPVLRGKIRAAVHDWLAVSRHAEQIAAVRNAHRRHGGGGSLYLILRR
ncbi:Smr/MutS family protein [Sphingomonas swuensis]|uniref:Smr/MutS family protein n=1 Tax=Sphingomonas swuensis TaxID=977800 RepID=A0ABP7T2G2_9SPHN